MSNTRAQTPSTGSPFQSSGVDSRHEGGSQAPRPLLLQARIDALHVAYQAQLESQILIELSSAQERARRTGIAQAFFVDGTPFELHGSGAGPKRFRLTNAHATITVGEDRFGFTIAIEFRAIFLATTALEDTRETADSVARFFTSKPFGEVRIRRLDLCADVTNVAYSAADLENFVGRPRRSVEYHAAQASARLTRLGPVHTGFTFSKGNPTMARLYNKTEELECYEPDDEKVLTETTAFRAGGWNGQAAVWRLEAQMKSPALRAFEATEPIELGSKLDGIWKYLFVGGQKGAWLRLIDPSTATRRERCTVDERWAIFTAAQFTNSAVEPVQRVLGRRRGLSVPEVIGSLLSHLGSAGRLRALDRPEPMEQLRIDLEAFYEQVSVSRVASDYLTRREAVAARFAGIRMRPHLAEDMAPGSNFGNVVPPTEDERKNLTFLQFVRSREADLFTSAPDFQREPTFDERPQYVARRRYYEQRLAAYSNAWRRASFQSTREPHPQHRLPFLAPRVRLEERGE